MYRKLLFLSLLVLLALSSCEYTELKLQENPNAAHWCDSNSDFFATIPRQTEEYISYVLQKYDQAPDQESRLDIISKEYLIALWGNGIESFNLYRRTEKPGNIQPAILPIPGNFQRTLLYPSVHVNRNGQVSQKTIYNPVFWDTNNREIFQC